MPQLTGGSRSSAKIPIHPILQALLDLAVPNATANTQRQADEINSRTQENKQLQQVQPKPEKPILNPYQEGVAKALKEGGMKFTYDAMAQGVPADHIIKEAKLDNTLSNTTQDNTLPNTTQDNTLPNTNPEAGVESLRKILPAKTMFTKQGIDDNGNVQLGGMFDFAGMSVDKMKILQELVGKQPLQEGEEKKLNILQDTERMKANIAARADLDKETKKNNFEQMKNIINEPTLAGDAIKLSTLATQGIEGASNILAGMDKFGDDYIKTLSTPNSYEGQKLATFASMILEANARSVGGATLSKNEIEFANAITTPTGRKAVFTNTKYARELTESILKKYKGIMNKVDPHSENRAAFRKARSLNYSVDEIMEHFKKNGIMQ